jgi:hypothetical protein
MRNCFSAFVTFSTVSAGKPIHNCVINVLIYGSFADFAKIHKFTENQTSRLVICENMPVYAKSEGGRALMLNLLRL